LDFEATRTWLEDRLGPLARFEIAGEQRSQSGWGDTT
jgi:hypothetical protein